MPYHSLFWGPEACCPYIALVLAGATCAPSTQGWKGTKLAECEACPCWVGNFKRALHETRLTQL